MSALERKANLFRNFIHGKYNKKHKVVFRCIVSPSGKLCQIQARRAGEIIKKQTIRWSYLDPIDEANLEGYAKSTLDQVGRMLDFQAA